MDGFFHLPNLRRHISVSLRQGESKKTFKQINVIEREPAYPSDLHIKGITFN